MRGGESQLICSIGKFSKALLFTVKFEIKFSEFNPDSLVSLPVLVWKSIPMFVLEIKVGRDDWSWQRVTAVSNISFIKYI